MIANRNTLAAARVHPLESTRLFFDRCAAEGLMADWSASEEASLRVLIPLWNIRRGHRVLEAGCGTGRLTACLAGLVGSRGEIVACDVSPGMIRRLLARRLPSQVRAVCAPVTKAGSPANCFDRIVCLNVFPHFHEPDAELREFRRTIRDHGWLWIAHCRSRAAVNRFHRRQGPEVSGDRLPAEREMRRLLANAGFDVRTLTDDERGYCLGAVPRAQAPR